MCCFYGSPSPPPRFASFQCSASGPPSAGTTAFANLRFAAATIYLTDCKQTTKKRDNSRKNIRNIVKHYIKTPHKNTQRKKMSVKYTIYNIVQHRTESGLYVVIIPIQALTCLVPKSGISRVLEPLTIGIIYKRCPNSGRIYVCIDISYCGSIRNMKCRCKCATLSHNASMR